MAVALALSAVGATGCVRTPVVPGEERLETFASDAELKAYVAEVVRQRERAHGFGTVPSVPSAPDPTDDEDETVANDDVDASSLGSLMQADPEAATAVHIDPGPGWRANLTVAEPHAGVVAVRGRQLLVLRRGRVTSIDLGAAPTSTRVVTSLSLAAAGGQGVRYDQLVVDGESVWAIGYDGRGGYVQVVELDLDASGALTLRSRWQLRFTDFYGSRAGSGKERSFSSQLANGGLRLYLPIPISLRDIGDELPAVRAPGDGSWRRILPATAIRRPLQRTHFPVLHTVVECAAGGVCAARGAIAPSSHDVYVSDRAAYAWVTADPYSDVTDLSHDERGSLLYRLPLDGGAPAAVRVGGRPNDALSFAERGDDVQVLVTDGNDEDPQFGADGLDVALLTLPLSAFGEQIGRTSALAYTELPKPPYSGFNLQARFVGDHLVYGNGTGGWDDAMAEPPIALVASRDGSRDVARLPLSHGVDQVEPSAGGAIVIGHAGGKVMFSSLALAGTPAVISTIVGPEVEPGELFRRASLLGLDTPGGGLMGVAIRDPRGPADTRLVHGSAGIDLHLLDGLKPQWVGSVLATPDERDDSCSTSCSRWYDDSQLVVVGERVFALLGYELVEVAIAGGQLREIGRVDFFPN